MGFAKAGCIFEGFAFAGGCTKVFVQKTLHYKCTIDRKVSGTPDTPYWHGLRPYRGGFQWASPIPPRYRILRKSLVLVKGYWHTGFTQGSLGTKTHRTNNQKS